MESFLRMTTDQYRKLRSHLFPGDGKEAIALALCGRRNGKRFHGLLVNEIVRIPYDECSIRGEDLITWPTDRVLPPLLEKASRRGMALMKIHSHPRGPASFSKLDDESDIELFGSVCGGWIDDNLPHASAIMLPSGEILGRLISAEGKFSPVSSVKVVGDDLVFWHNSTVVPDRQGFTLRNAQAFGQGTVDKLRKLRVAVVGCSGTGSPVIEQLARLGVGYLILVDPDHVEEKNLNRILNSTRWDAEACALKVDVQAWAIKAMGLGTEVETYPFDLFERTVIQAIAECDVVFGCMDGAEGRHLLNRLATFYSLPYFDVGVKLVADGNGGIDQICGTVHYLQPGKSSLLSRGVFSMEDVRAEGTKRTDPSHFEQQRKEKYIKGVQEDRPAVITVNMFYASVAVNEFLARLHSYRLDPNSDYAIHRMSLSHFLFEKEGEQEPCASLAHCVGRGDARPLLNMPELGIIEA